MNAAEHAGDALAAGPQIATSPADKWAWLRAVIVSGDRTLGRIAVAAALAQHFNVQTGAAWPAERTISEWTRLDRRNVQRAITELAEAGFLAVLERGGPRRSTRYALVMDAIQRPQRTPQSVPKRKEAKRKLSEPKGRAHRARRQRVPRHRRARGAALRRISRRYPPMAKRSAQIIEHPARVPEPAILSDVELAKGLAHRRSLKGGYWGVSPAPELPELAAADRELLAALRRWRKAEGDGAYTAAVARGLVGSFPNTRVDAEAYAAGLAAIAEDDRVSADIVRAVCRKVRAERRSLPPLADIREELLREVSERGALLAGLEDYRRQWLAEAQREAAEAGRIAEAAARAGVQLTAEDVRDGWRGLSAVGWLHDRERTPPRTYLYLEDHAIAAVLAGGPNATIAARLLARVAPHERAREAALVEARDRFARLPDDAPEWREWEAAWPVFCERFGEECDALADALGLIPE